MCFFSTKEQHLNITKRFIDIIVFYNSRLQFSITMLLPCILTLVVINNNVVSTSVSGKPELLHKLTRCAEEVLEIVDTTSEITNNVFSIEELNRTLENLESATQEELDIYKDVLDNLTQKNKPNQTNNLSILQDFEIQLNKAESGSSATDQTCSRQNLDGIVNNNAGKWLSQPGNGPTDYYGRRRSPRPTGELGATIISKFEVCSEESYCNVQGIGVLSDGLVAFPDSDTFEIKVYNVDGSLIRKVSTVPLAPLSITHLKDYTVLCRVRTLGAKTNAVMKVDLWTGKSKIILNLGTSACHGGIGVIFPNIFIFCEPYMFIYHINGTMLRRLSSDPNRSGIVSVFNAEAGTNQSVLSGRSFPGITASYGEMSVFDENFVEICKFRDYKVGVVGQNGIIYATQGDSDRIVTINNECNITGIVASFKRKKRIRHLAIFNNILYVTLTKERRFKESNFVLAIKLP